MELAFLEDLASGVFQVECLTRAELQQARATVEQYRDLRIGLADASLVILAARHRTDRICTFDQRAYRSIRPPGGGPFVLLPADV